MQIVSNLLNKNAWSRFAQGVNGATAIGAPTLEMYIASWNGKYSNDKLYYDTITTMGKFSGKGYYVGENEMPTTERVDMSSKMGYLDTLYYPHTTTYDNCKGYWLASPSATWTIQVGDESYLMSVTCDGQVNSWSNFFSYHMLGIRPLVCLPSGTTLTQEANGIWSIY